LNIVSTTIDATLVERLRRGEYDVDAHAVADAIVRRWRSTSLVLVAAQALDGPAVAADEGEPEAGPDLA
jgi:hypothetical protein